MLTRERLEAMVEAYHRARGLDKLVQERHPAALPWP
jgi:hypothetical protein